MILSEIVEKYAITKVCKDGICYEVGSKEYIENERQEVKAFELEEDFMNMDRTLKIL